ncbi:MAG: tetratricopeptide repeat protein, partial [Phycisphaerae bacterium]
MSRAIERDGATPAHTLDGQLVGTLAYMSPEQITGTSDELDTRSDIYSLAVVLFELLTRRLPHDVPNSSLASHVASAQRDPIRLDVVARRFRGDLSTIVRKALSVDRDQRYGSVAEFAADLNHYLRREPIDARPATTTYRLRKFVQRNKLLVGSSLAVALSLINGFGAENYRRRQAVTAQQTAELEAARAAQIIRFLNDMLIGAAPDSVDGPDVTVRELVDRVSERMNEDAQRDPFVQVGIHALIGRLYFELGEYEKARRILKEGIEIAESNQLINGDVFTLHGRYASTLRSLGDHETAKAAFQRALEVGRRALGPSDPRLIPLLNNQAELHFLNGENERVAETLETLYPLLRDDAGAPLPEYYGIRGNLGVVYKQLGRLQEAHALLRESSTWYHDHWGPKHTMTLALQDRLAGVEFSLGNYEKAIELSRETLRDFREQLGPDHPQYAKVAYVHASRLLQADRVTEAAPLLSEALDIQSRILGDDAVDTARTRGALGEARVLQGFPAEGFGAQRHAIEVLRRHGKSQYHALAGALHALSQSLVAAGRADEQEALDAAEEATRLCEETLP